MPPGAETYFRQMADSASNDLLPADGYGALP